MAINRKRFLQLSGASMLALAGRKAAGALDAVSQHAPTGTGKRWAMVIDSRKCRQQEGCDKCIQACHLTHNVPKFDDPRHEVKWIWKESFKDAFVDHSVYANEGLKEQSFLVFCNHCDEPPCVRVCPTQATWKREEDGLVMMDWHRCIGCRYCMAGCPYGSRSFNWVDPRPKITEVNEDYPTRSKGVVEKCTFCDERLAQGLLPACVEACEEKALVFGDLNDPNSEILQVLQSNFTIRRKPELGTRPEIYYIV